MMVLLFSQGHSNEHWIEKVVGDFTPTHPIRLVGWLKDVKPLSLSQRAKWLGSGCKIFPPRPMLACKCFQCIHETATQHAQAIMHITTDLDSLTFASCASHHDNHMCPLRLLQDQNFMAQMFFCSSPLWDALAVRACHWYKVIEDIRTETSPAGTMLQEHLTLRSCSFANLSDIRITAAQAWTRPVLK